MKINHIAVWVSDLEKSRKFYVKYFGGISNEKYVNKKGFSSYFISYGQVRIELMHKDNLLITNQSLGYTHVAFSVGTKEQVDRLTEELAFDGYTTTQARTTGDGYYESTVLDPDGNLIEITV